MRTGCNALVKKILPLLMLALAAGCASTSGTADAPVAASHDPVAPTANVSKNEAWHDAMLMTRLEGDRLAVLGGGASMQPVYGQGTVLVLKRIPYDDLKLGMTVAYIDHNGVKVVHKLVDKQDGGWRVMGLNNAWIDMDLVTATNLIGVVYATLYSDGEETK